MNWAPDSQMMIVVDDISKISAEIEFPRAVWKSSGGNDSFPHGVIRKGLWLVNVDNSGKCALQLRKSRSRKAGFSQEFMHSVYSSRTLADSLTAEIHASVQTYLNLSLEILGHFPAEIPFMAAFVLLERQNTVPGAHGAKPISTGRLDSTIIQESPRAAVAFPLVVVAS